jgi:glycosyltransferase involved in cell wall biosynthesis
VDPVGGGPIEGITRLGAALPAFGARSEIVSLDDPNDPWVAAHPMKVHAVGPGILKYRYSPKLVSWIKQHAASYDVVIINGLWQYSSYGVWRGLRGSNVPYVVFPHGMLGPWFKRKHRLKHVKKWLYWPWAEYRVIRDARATVFTCEEERLRARESFWLYRSKEAVISYGTADPGDGSDNDWNQFLERFPQLKGQPFILYLGRLHPTKGCDTLLKAFAKAPRSDLKLVMAGPDKINWKKPLTDLAEKLGVNDRITWTGQLNGAQKWGAFRAADAFILASHHENFGIAVAEALGCGLPVLITDQVNIWREIAADGAGLVDSDSVSGVENLINRWLALPDSEKSKMRKQSRETFLKRFEISHTARSLLSVLDPIVNQR